MCARLVYEYKLVWWFPPCPYHYYNHPSIDMEVAAAHRWRIPKEKNSAFIIFSTGRFCALSKQEQLTLVDNLWFSVNSTAANWWVSNVSVKKVCKIIGIVFKNHSHQFAAAILLVIFVLSKWLFEQNFSHIFYCLPDISFSFTKID